MTTYNNIFWIKERMKNALTQKEFAKVLGVAESTYNRWENSDKETIKARKVAIIYFENKRNSKRFIKKYLQNASL